MADEDFHRDISRELGNFSGHLGRIDERLEKIENHLADQNKRIDKMEKWKASIRAKVAVVSSAVATAATIAVAFIKSKF